MPAIRLPRAPRTDDELWWVIKALWGIELPRVAVCPGHVSPFEAVAHAYFGREPNFAVWYASRGSGKSLALAALGLTKTFVADADCTILGGSIWQSQNVREHMSKMLRWPNAPTYAIRRDITTMIETTTRKQIKPLPASQTSVRGPHPPLQLLDEIDEMEYKIYEAALGQAMEQLNTRGEIIGEYIVASSTWQNPVGTMTKVIDDARKKGLPVFTWCLKELVKSPANPSGWMTDRFIATKKRAVSAEMWRCLAEGEPVQTRRGDVAIEGIKDGDEVWTRAGWRPVTALVRQPDRHVYTVTTDDGRSFTATANHPAATPSGWKLTGELQSGDALLTADPPHSLPPARSADLMPFAVDVGLNGSVVPVAAGGPGVSVPVSVASVVGSGLEPEMVGVHTAGIAATVINRHVVRDRTAAVDARRHRTTSALVVTGGAALGETVEDGTAAVHTGICYVANVAKSQIPVPTWDISVKGTHEFTVRGLLVHNTEYELNEPSGTSRAFDLNAIELYFTDYPAPIFEEHLEGDIDDTWVWEKPVANGEYAAGADWAKEQDKTVLAVIRVDCLPRRLVALRRMNRQKYPVMTAAFSKLVSDYHATAQHDKTGVGNALNDFLDDDAAKGFVMVGRQRAQMFSNYIADFEHGAYRLPRNAIDSEGHASFYRGHRGATVADVFAPHKWDEHTPDDVVAMAMAHRAAGQAPIPAGDEQMGVPRDDSVLRKVDAPFNLTPDGFRIEGEVSIEDTRYEDVFLDMMIGGGRDDIHVWL